MCCKLCDIEATAITSIKLNRAAANMITRGSEWWDAGVGLVWKRVDGGFLFLFCVGKHAVTCDIGRRQRTAPLQLWSQEEASDEMPILVLRCFYVVDKYVVLPRSKWTALLQMWSRGEVSDGNLLFALCLQVCQKLWYREATSMWIWSWEELSW